MNPTTQQLRRKHTLIGFSLPPQLEDPIPLTRPSSYEQRPVFIPPARRRKLVQVQRIDTNHPTWGWAALGVMALTALIAAVAL